MTHQGKVLGFRTWRLDGHNLASEVTSIGFKWRLDEPNHAECMWERFSPHTRNLRSVPVEHEAPHPDCMCGFYAFHHPSPSVWASQDVVFGAILAWGHLEVHCDGFRAEWAQPVVLGHCAHQPRVQALAGEMCLPCVPVDQLEREAMKHGSTVPGCFRPPPPHQIQGVSRDPRG